jgi:hypothetical protein
MPTTEEITEQVRELEGKALSFVKDAQAPVVDYVAKIAETLAGRLPEDRPQALAQGFDVLAGQVDFAKKVLDTQVDFVKAVLDAAIAPIKPAPVKKTVKAATAA